MHYSHLTREQRSQISALKSIGMSHRSIALQLGVASTTIDREIRRNGYRQRGFKDQRSHEQAVARRKKARSKRMKLTPDLASQIGDKLTLYWSPEQISGWLRKKSVFIRT